MGSTVQHLIQQYGLLGVFLGAAVEGELGVIIGGAAARMGQLNPWLVALSAWVAAFISAEIFFGLGRSQRDGRWVHKITDKRAFALSIHWIERHPRLFCFAYRFIYGFRVVGPVAISLSQVSARTFAVFNFASALVWAAAATLLGWLFGVDVVEWIKPYLTPENFIVASAVAAILLLVIIAWRARRADARRARDRQTEADDDADQAGATSGS